MINRNENVKHKTKHLVLRKAGWAAIEVRWSFKSTSRYLDDLLNIDNPYFEGMVNCIYPPELQLNKANTSDNEAPFLDLHLSISNGFVSSKIYDKRDDFDFDIVNLSVIYLFHVMIHWWVRKPPRGPNNCMFWAMIEAEGEVRRL